MSAACTLGTTPITIIATVIDQSSQGEGRPGRQGDHVSSSAGTLSTISSFGVVLQPRDGPPRPRDEQRVAQAKGSSMHAPGDGRLAPLEADDREPVERAEPGRDHRLTDQPGGRRDHQLGHADRLGRSEK